jgi:hypothetical protein
LRKIYGPVKDRYNWRIRTNWELDTLTGGVNIVRYIKAQRLRWFGHIQRMEDDRMVKKTNQLETIWEKASRKTQE